MNIWPQFLQRPFLPARESSTSNDCPQLEHWNAITTGHLSRGKDPERTTPHVGSSSYALKFVLSTFDGKVDTVLSRIKPANQGKLIEEIKDAYALVNRDGEVYKNARIQKEYQPE